MTPARPDPPARREPVARLAPGPILRQHIAAGGGLVNVSDLARHWHLSETRVRQLMREPDFPPSADRVAGGRIAIWLLAECEGWKHAREDRFRVRG